MYTAIRENVETGVVEAISKNEKLLIEDVNEKTINIRIAIALEKQFPEWDVDTEYNRFGIGQKTKIISASKERFLQYASKGIAPQYDITLQELYDNPEKAPVYPDIIVHKRTEEFSNFLIVEVKKENNPELFNGWDEWKIKFFLHTFQYRYGAQVILKTSKKYEDPSDYISAIKIWPEIE
jgi:hypothetical protein